MDTGSKPNLQEGEANNLTEPLLSSSNILTETVISEANPTSSSQTIGGHVTKELGQKAILKLQVKKLRIQLKKQGLHVKKLQLQLEQAMKNSVQTALSGQETQKKFQGRTFYEGPYLISFPKDSDAYRSSQDTPHGHISPYFYRCFHELNATLTPFMSKNCWPSEHPELKEHAAFQSLGEFLPIRNFTKESCMRHFNWNQKRPTTSLISTFDVFYKAEKRAHFHYKVSRRTARRISIARIKTAGLVPAFFEATMPSREVPDTAKSTTEEGSEDQEKFCLPASKPSSTVSRGSGDTQGRIIDDEQLTNCVSSESVRTNKKFTKQVEANGIDKTDSALPSAADTESNLPRSSAMADSDPISKLATATTMEKHRVKIPIWVRDTAKPTDGSDITLEQLGKSGADYWISVKENRASGLNLPDGWYGQPEEWLACGTIPMSAIVNVWPYDGDKVHRKEGTEVVTSSDNQDWKYDWASKIWRSAYEMVAINQALLRDAQKKRTISDRDRSEESRSSKRSKSDHKSKILEFTNIGV